MADIAAAAALLAETRRARAPIDALPPDLAPVDVAEAYAIQDRMLELTGAGTAGWKVAATTAATRMALGVTEPFSGRLLTGTIDDSPATELVADFAGRPSLECELGLWLGADLGPEGAPYTAASVAGTIEAVSACFEVPCLRYGDLRTAGPLGVIADNAAAARMVVGPRRSVADIGSLDEVTAVLTVNGAEVARGVGADIDGGPLGSLAWLANHLAARGMPLSVGSLISSGALNGIHPMATGDRAIGDFGPVLGTIEVAFV